MAEYYSNWREKDYECGDCNWRGKGSQLQSCEWYRELFEVCCPVCGKKLDNILYPTLAESRQNWDNASKADKWMMERIEEKQREFAARKLESSEQLPDLEGDDLILVWDVTEYNGGDVLIKYGERVIWSEPSFYENYKRFATVAALLKKKYGDSLQDFIPTRKSWLYLYGDSMSSVDYVAEIRKSLSRQP